MEAHVSQSFVSFHAGDTEGDHREADLGDGGEGQHAFDVGLHAGDYRGVEGGDGSHDRDEHEYFGCLEVVDGEQAGHEVDSGNDHGGRVDQCRHGGRSFHGVGQPDV